MLSLQFGGAVGTLAALRGDGPEVARALATDLQLTLPTLPWHAHRDRVAEIAAYLGLLTGTLGKIARDISLHSQTEVGELCEPAGQGQGRLVDHAAQAQPGDVRDCFGGSYVASQAWSAPCSPRCRRNTNVDWAAGTLNGKRSRRLFASPAGRFIILPRCCRIWKWIPRRMKQNLDATNGLIFAEAVSMALADRMGKMPAHLLVEAACKKSAEQKRSLKEVLREEPGLHGHLTPADLESLFDPRNYLGSAEEFVERAIAETRKFPPAV